MKKYIPFLLLLVLIACVSQLDEPTDSPSAKLPERSHRFSFDSTAVLISNLLAKPDLNRIASAYASGGTFPAAQMKLSSNSIGIIFWYCFKPGKHPELFLAMEQLEKYDMKNLPQRPSSATLLIPEFTFNNANGSTAAIPSVKDYLRNQVVPKPGSKQIDNASVTRYINSFDSLMTKMADEKGEKYNKYPFSFFARNKAKELEQFLEQAGNEGFVKYYFGYDENDKPNRIRVILVSGDVAGKNQVMTRQKEDPLILQKSWPPPVDGNQ